MNYFENMKHLSISSKLSKMNKERHDLVQELEKLLKNFDDKYFIEDKVDREKVIADLRAGDSNLLQVLNDNKLFKELFGREGEGSSGIDTDRLIQTIQADEYWTNYYR